MGTALEAGKLRAGRRGRREGTEDAESVEKARRTRGRRGGRGEQADGDMIDAATEHVPTPIRLVMLVVKG
jgi:hypothetical protein